MIVVRVRYLNDIDKISADTRVVLWDIDICLEVGYIPYGVTWLEFDHNFNQKLEKNHIPNSVTHLFFGGRFNQPLEKGHIPNGVIYLSFGRFFNQKIEKNHIPDSVTHLSFGQCFNQKLDPESIPADLKYVTCVCRNTPIDLSNIPLYVEVFIIPYYDNENIVLSNVRHKIHVNAGHLDKQIIDNEMEGVYYIDTIEKNSIKYILVHGDDYIPVTTAKSARK